MKSVKMLSEELKVSKQTIFNNIKRLNIETIKKENTSFIKEDTDIERIIQRVNENKKKYGFESNTAHRKNNESDNVESENDNQIIEILKNQIETLNRQIEKQENRHEKTLEFYRKELQVRSKLLENQQVLALESNKKIQKLENQLEEERQLNYSKDQGTTSNNQNIDAEEVQYTTNDTEINQHEDRSASQNEASFEEVESESVKANSDEINPNVKSKKGFWSRLFNNY
ncbi:DUF536 domain-containing protein [Staphylococcus aureus]|uniref:DUF536 domain-containing protein n=1 Tax=Staphylococcus aureus TaxID=1280 RepID=UPI0018E98CF3|nr:DUF536 domain-containing protein [Staphylococcus aureus]MBJ6131155.1 DUF536 domain-containing protein [Staphylococcus aureus]MBJ6141731.1 DUF536 domain-containing protein [Staphylococcus aureus]MBJ6153798.1 DUF536 domain-containing protein [Staphylococcus aureus]MBJ6156488.1 DUF536 domain-containing protein [Staphylococcus aureus]MBJ6159058.1 DUF536 domain-containing protein [Staphylococcus aureus]